jgi:hypothetical protein
MDAKNNIENPENINNIAYYLNKNILSNNKILNKK